MKILLSYIYISADIFYLYLVKAIYYHIVKSQAEKFHHFAKNRPLNSVSQCNLDVLRASKVKQPKISVFYPCVNLLKSSAVCQSWFHRLYNYNCTIAENNFRQYMHRFSFYIHAKLTDHTCNIFLLYYPKIYIYTEIRYYMIVDKMYSSPAQKSSVS